MGDSICLQPWISVAGNGNTLVQDEADWVDVADHRDVTVYTEVSYALDQAGATVLQVQTSPVKEDPYFSMGLSLLTPYIATYSFSTSPTLGVQPLKIIRWASVTQTAPLGRWVRWRVSFPSLTNQTPFCFRIWLNLNRGQR